MNTFPPDPPVPSFTRDERVMVMGEVGGWKVELWAPEGGDSIKLAGGFPEMDLAEQWADEVREILDRWDEAR